MNWQIQEAIVAAKLPNVDSNCDKYAVIEQNGKKQWRSLVFIPPLNVGSPERQYRDGLAIADYIIQKCAFRQPQSRNHVLVQPVSPDTAWQKQNSFVYGEHVIPETMPSGKAPGTVAIRLSTAHTVAAHFPANEKLDSNRALISKRARSESDSESSRSNQDSAMEGFLTSKNDSLPKSAETRQPASVANATSSGASPLSFFAPPRPAQGTKPLLRASQNGAAGESQSIPSNQEMETKKQEYDAVKQRLDDAKKMKERLTVLLAAKYAEKLAAATNEEKQVLGEIDHLKKEFCEIGVNMEFDANSESQDVLSSVSTPAPKR